MVACLLLGTVSLTNAAVYYGNAYDPESPGSGGTVAGGTLSFTDNGTTISGTFHRGNGSFQDNIVIFIDSRSGGFANTTSFTDSTFGFPSAISGFNGTSRSTGIFASGFGADYAIALGVNNPTGGELFELAADGSLIDLGSVNLSPNNQLNEPDYTFRFRWSDIGLTGGSGFTFETTYVTSTGSRSLESFEGTTGQGGFNHTITFTNFDTYGLVNAVPEPKEWGMFSALSLLGFASLRHWWPRRKD
jgi:hypothetical protein